MVYGLFNTIIGNSISSHTPFPYENKWDEIETIPTHSSRCPGRPGKPHAGPSHKDLLNPPLWQPMTRPSEKETIKHIGFYWIRYLGKQMDTNGEAIAGIKPSTPSYWKWKEKTKTECQLLLLNSDFLWLPKLSTFIIFQRDSSGKLPSESIPRLSPRIFFSTFGTTALALAAGRRPGAEVRAAPDWVRETATRYVLGRKVVEIYPLVMTDIAVAHGLFKFIHSET